MSKSVSVLKVAAFVFPLVCVSAASRAEVPHTFAAGEPAVADHINDNFSDLDDRIIDLGERVADQSNGINQTVEVDCGEHPDAFQEGTDNPGGQVAINSHTTYILTGLCDGPIWIVERNSVRFEGDDSGEKDDGVILQAGLSEHPYAAIGAWESNNVSLENLTVSAANYVSKSYSFGENVTALSAGDGSHVEVVDVSFLGGDLGVSVYRNAVLRLREGVTVTGFNYIGLEAWMGGSITTNGNITVTGIDGTSTEDFVYAINSSSNGTVYIRAGGNFTAGSNANTQDLSTDDIYPAALWASDNSTVLVRGGSNAVVFDGAVEVGYSAMVRMAGDITINGLIGVYHGGVMHLTNVVQDTDNIWVGDKGHLRVESGNLSPLSYYGSPIDVYRQGSIRMNNTVVNLVNDDVFSVGGLSYINLRGATNLNGADISCWGGSNHISIRDTVIGVGELNNCF